MKNRVLVIIGAGGIGLAIARRVGAGKTVLLADLKADALKLGAEALIDAGYSVETRTVDVASRASVHELAEAAASLGDVVQIVNTAGLSPNMAAADKILAVDLYGTALVLEEFRSVVAEGGSLVVISSMAGHMVWPISKEQEDALAITPTDELLALPFVKAVDQPGLAYGMSKRGNHLRIQAEAGLWAARGARVNSISPGIILTALARHEMNSPIGDGYRALIANSATKRVGTPDEVASAAAYLLGSDAAFITGSDLLMDGGVIAWMRTGQLKPGEAK